MNDLADKIKEIIEDEPELAKSLGVYLCPVSD